MTTIRFLRKNVDYLGDGTWVEDAICDETFTKYRIKFIRRIYQEEPWMKLEILESTPMKNNTAEVVDFHEELVRLQHEEAIAKAGGSGGGFDHFTGMTIGTIFASLANGNHGSYLDEYQLVSRQGITVLLGNRYNDRLERHIGSKFWKLNTLVQILHVPEKENNNGNSVPD